LTQLLETVPATNQFAAGDMGADAGLRKSKPSKPKNVGAETKNTNKACVMFDSIAGGKPGYVWSLGAQAGSQSC
tara:strand:- start:1167 stop:1388 length:222 start_codon:yes stop_codon:yes gene_type:complete